MLDHPRGRGQVRLGQALGDFAPDLLGDFQNFGQHGRGGLSQVHCIDPPVSGDRLATYKAAALQVVQLTNKRRGFDADPRRQLLLAQPISGFLQFEKCVPAGLRQIDMLEALVEAVAPSTTCKRDGPAESDFKRHGPGE